MEYSYRTATEMCDNLIERYKKNIEILQRTKRDMGFVQVQGFLIDEHGTKEQKEELNKSRLIKINALMKEFFVYRYF